MHEPPSTTVTAAPPAESEHALTSLKLIEQLARDCAVTFDRVQVRRVLREHPAGQAAQASERIRRLPQVLSSVGLQGRIRYLSLANALEACRNGASLVTAIPGEEPEDAWILIRSAGLSKARLASEKGADAWITRDQLGRLLRVEEEGTTLAWLLAEPALPCASDPGPAPATALHHEAEQGHQAAHLPPLRRLIGILRPEASDIWIVTVFSAVVSLLALATPVTVEALVNTVAFGRLLQPVVVLSLVLFGFLGFAAAIRVLQAYVAEIIQRRLFVRVVADLSQRLPRVRQDAYEGGHGPELLNRFFDVMTVQKSAALLVLDGIAIVLQSAVGMAVLAFYHPLLFGFDVFLLAALAFVVLVLGRGGVATSIDESKAKYAVAAWLEQLALCPLTFKNAGGAERAVEQADQLAIDYLRAREQHFRVLMRQIAFTLGLQALAGSVLLGIGGWLVIQGQLTLGQLVAAELIVALIVGSFAKLGKHLEAYYDLLAAVDKLGHLFDLPVERQAGESLPDSPQGLSVRLGVHPIAPGELIAVIGPPGSGKSHLLSAAFGLSGWHHDAPQIDGIEVGVLNLAALRSQVALVRHCEIFAGTIADNVHLSRSEGTRAAVRACLEELGMREDLQQLPAGLDTPVQPGGVPLTDTQARCVVLARALLSQPRLLLIDGLLDGLSDDALPEVMEALTRRTAHTTIVIATGRNNVAHYCQRSIPLSPTTPAQRGETPRTASLQHH
jgi:putative ABC transport system ATP-binding protein